jgi:hypothetical protein
MDRSGFLHMSLDPAAFFGQQMTLPGTFVPKFPRGANFKSFGNAAMCLEFRHF